MRVSVFIPTRDSHKLSISLTSLLTSFSHLVERIVIYDNGDHTVTWDERVRDLIDAFHKEGVEVLVVRRKWDGQYGEGYKRALSLASGRYVLVMEEDIILQSGSLEGLIQCLDMGCDVCTASIVNPNNLPGYPDYDDSVLNSLPETDWEPTKIYRRYSFNDCKAVKFVTTALYMTTPTVLDVIKSFKPVIELGYDMQLSKYLLKRGFKLCLCTGATAYHLTPSPRNPEEIRQEITKQVVRLCEF